MTTPDTPEMKPLTCPNPWCARMWQSYHKIELKNWRLEELFDKWSYVCSCCGTASPVCATKELALEAWNHRPTPQPSSEYVRMVEVVERICKLAEGTTPGEWKRIKGETEDGSEGYAWLNESGHDLFMCADPNKKANILFVNKIRRELPNLLTALATLKSHPTPAQEPK